MKNKDRKWLELCASSAGSGMYPGIQQDVVPASASKRLLRDGLISVYYPHNGAHKDRFIATTEGRHALSRPEREAGQ